jgi:hypothetical protein
VSDDEVWPPSDDTDVDDEVWGDTEPDDAYDADDDVEE